MESPLRLGCPGCEARFEVPEGFLPPSGGRLRCPTCSSLFSALPNGLTMLMQRARVDKGPQGKLRGEVRKATESKQELPDRDVVVDHGNDLMWTRKDNGVDIDGDAVERYAEKCIAGGYRDWRLPTLTELKSLYDGTDRFGSGRATTRLGVELTGELYWSSEVDERNSMRGILSLRYGRSKMESCDSDYRRRVLCVREV